jgi:hypothetical protein
MKPNLNLPPQHQQMQAELYGRIDTEHRKERDESLLFKLKIILFAAVVLLGCIGISKCQGEQAAQQKEQELNRTIECK